MGGHHNSMNGIPWIYPQKRRLLQKGFWIVAKIANALIKLRNVP